MSKELDILCGENIRKIHVKATNDRTKPTLSGSLTAHAGLYKL